MRKRSAIIFGTGAMSKRTAIIGTCRSTAIDTADGSSRSTQGAPRQAQDQNRMKCVICSRPRLAWGSEESMGAGYSASSHTCFPKKRSASPMRTTNCLLTDRPERRNESGKAIGEDARALFRSASATNSSAKLASHRVFAGNCASQSSAEISPAMRTT